METGVGTLAYAYYYDHYVTYPVGYAKNVRISEAEKQEIAGIIYDLTGVKADEIEDNIASYFQENDIQTTQYKVPLKDGITYEQFLKDMEQVADILGPGSEYTEDRLWLNVMISVDYEGAVENYRALTEQDGLTGGYTRLFCDYMGIIEQSFITSDLKKTLKHTHSKRFPTTSRPCE